MRRNIYIFVGMILLIGIVCSCGVQTGAYKGIFYTLNMSDVWEHKEYTGELLKSTGSASYALFSKAPIQINQWNDEDNLEYGLVCASYFDSKVEQSEFRNIGSLPLNSFIKELYSSTEYISGLKARLTEYEIKSTTFNIMLTVPLNKGYVEVRGWCPIGNKDLIEEYRVITKTLSINDSDYFLKHPN